ncbi:MAG: trigger factor [Gammaproteobacteria bacterium]|nr:trigger factor [Gammaproteobacteria bacterium]
MQVSVETTSGLERKMTVEVPSEDIDSAVHERLQSLSKTAKMNGFRPGKVPYKVVKKRFEPQVRGEVLGDVINRSFQDAVMQEKLRLAGSPKIEPLDDTTLESSSEGFRYTAVFEVYPEFEPRFDASIKVERPSVDIGEADIDEVLESLRKQRTEFSDVERPAANEDQIEIDFTGRVDGEEFEGGKAEKAPLVLGSRSMIEGFEDQLIGLSSGEDKTITVKFPEAYGAEHLAGKEAEFDIHVHSVKEPRLPEINEELVKSFGIDDGTLESLRADIEKNMSKELKQRVDAQVKQQVMDGLLDLNEVEVPSALVQQEIGRLKEQLAQQMPPDSAPADMPDELFADEADKRVRLGLVIGEIVRTKELKPDDADIRQQVESIASSYQDSQQVIDYYYSNRELMQNVEGLVLEETVTRTVLEQATVTDKPMTFQEIMNPPAAEPETEANKGEQD